MPAATFDTHRIVKRLKEAGASDALAETVTDVFREVREADLSQLATKADVADMATKQDLLLLEQRMTIKLDSLIVLAVGAVATLKLL